MRDGSSRSAPSRYPGPGLPFIPGYPVYPGVPPSRGPRSIRGYPLYPRVSSLSGHPLYLGMSSMSGYPSIPRYPPSRGTLYPGVFPISGYPLFPEVPPLSLGTRSGHERARFHLKQFQIKLQFKISPNVGVSRLCPPKAALAAETQR